MLFVIVSARQLSNSSAELSMALKVGDYASFAGSFLAQALIGLLGIFLIALGLRTNK